VSSIENPEDVPSLESGEVGIEGHEPEDPYIETQRLVDEEQEPAQRQRPAADIPTPVPPVPRAGAPVATGARYIAPPALEKVSLSVDHAVLPPTNSDADLPPSDNGSQPERPEKPAETPAPAEGGDGDDEPPTDPPPTDGSPSDDDGDPKTKWLEGKSAFVRDLSEQENRDYDILSERDKNLYGENHQADLGYNWYEGRYIAEKPGVRVDTSIRQEETGDTIAEIEKVHVLTGIRNMDVGSHALAETVDALAIQDVDKVEGVVPSVAVARTVFRGVGFDRIKITTTDPTDELEREVELPMTQHQALDYMDRMEKRGDDPSLKMSIDLKAERYKRMEAQSKELANMAEWELAERQQADYYPFAATVRDIKRETDMYGDSLDHPLVGTEGNNAQFELRQIKGRGYPSDNLGTATGYVARIFQGFGPDATNEDVLMLRYSEEDRVMALERARQMRPDVQGNVERMVAHEPVIEINRAIGEVPTIIMTEVRGQALETVLPSETMGLVRALEETRATIVDMVQQGIVPPLDLLKHTHWDGRHVGFTRPEPVFASDENVLRTMAREKFRSVVSIMATRMDPRGLGSVVNYRQTMQEYARLMESFNEYWEQTRV
jgi:hypothetical protein